MNFDHFLKIIDYRSGKLDKLESTLTDDCLLKLSKESAFTTKYDVHDGTFNSVPVKVYIFIISGEFYFSILEPGNTWGAINSIRPRGSNFTPNIG